MSIDFVAIDFETANRHRSSPCSVGLARVRDGEIVKTAHWLMRPPTATDGFEARNVAVHGITAAMIADQPCFGERYPALIKGLGGDVLVAHNAVFDIGVLIESCKADRLPVPDPRYVCTRDTSRLVLPHLGNFRLPTVAAELGVSLTNHHDGLADAIAAAEVMIALAAHAGWDSIEHLARTKSPVSPSRVYGQFGGRARGGSRRSATFA